MEEHRSEGKKRREEGGGRKGIRLANQSIDRKMGSCYDGILK